MANDPQATVQDNNIPGTPGYQRRHGLTPKNPDNEADGYVIVYSEEGKQHIKQHIKNDVKSAYDTVKDNPTAANVANALKAKFGSNEWFDENHAKRIGEPDKIAAVDDAVKKATGPDGKISPDKLDAISNSLIDQTSGPMDRLRHSLGSLGAEHIDFSKLGGAKMEAFVNVLIHAIEEFFGVKEGHAPHVVGSANGGVAALQQQAPSLAPTIAPAAPSANATLGMNAPKAG